MPLLDHFHPPVNEIIQWNTFHHVWASTLADQLTEIVPDEFRVYESLKLGGGTEIDVAAVRQSAGANGTDTPRTSDWQPPAPGGDTELVFPDRFEVLVYRSFGGRQLVAAIELVSPGNKDENVNRAAFTMKVAGYLHEGVSVLIVDVVTERRANLHDEVVRLMGLPEDLRLPPEPPLYAAAYRPVLRAGRPRLEAWVTPFSLGDALPTMPLRLIADYFVPVELERAYVTACRRRRLI